MPEAPAPTPNRPVPWNVEKGTFGSMWPIRPIPVRGGELRGKSWLMQLAAGVPAVFIQSSDIDQAHAVPDQRRVVERYLDLLSWEGGGHYELDPLHPKAEHMLWDWTGDEPRVQLTVLLETRVPFSLSVQPEGTAPFTEARKYHSALRYFRCAQVASNPVAAFQNLFLAFEHLAAERVTRAGRGTDRAWLRDTVDQLVSEYPEEVREGLPDAALGDAFIEEVYEAVRCATFHAKPQKAPIAPFDEQEDQVRQAYDLLEPHVLELLRSATGRPVGYRVARDRDMEDSGEFVADWSKIAFVYHKPKEKTWMREGSTGRVEEGGLATFRFQTQMEPEEAEAVSKVGWQIGPMVPWHEFSVFPRADERMRLDIRLIARARFDGLIRSPASVLDNITELPQ